MGPDEADEDQAGTNKLELCFALPTHISQVRRWDRLLLRKLSPRQTAGLDHCKLVAESEADEDQTGTNSLELCFALPTHISPVRCWDKLLLRKLNPRQTAALDHYKSHPQIFLSPSVTLKIIKPFYYYLLQKSELYIFCFTTNILRISVFSCQICFSTL